MDFCNLEFRLKSLNFIDHWFSASITYRGARWLSGKVSDSEARGRGVRNLPLPCCFLEQDTLLPESTG